MFSKIFLYNSHKGQEYMAAPVSLTGKWNSYSGRYVLDTEKFNNYYNSRDQVVGQELNVTMEIDQQYIFDLVDLQSKKEIVTKKEVEDIVVSSFSAEGGCVFFDEKIKNEEIPKKRYELVDSIIDRIVDNFWVEEYPKYKIEIAKRQDEEAVLSRLKGKVPTFYKSKSKEFAGKKVGELVKRGGVYSIIEYTMPDNIQDYLLNKTGNFCQGVMLGGDDFKMSYRLHSEYKTGDLYFL